MGEGDERLTARDWKQAPEIQTMYNVPLPVSVLRTRIREEFERHRFAKKLPVVDVLIFKSHAEYQVCAPSVVRSRRAGPEREMGGTTADNTTNRRR